VGIEPSVKLVGRCISKFRKAVAGALSALQLSLKFCLAKLSGKQVIVFQLHATNQLPHIESVLRRLACRPFNDRYICFVLVKEQEIACCEKQINNISLEIGLSSYYATSFLLFWDVVFAVDQRMRLPLININKGTRICIYHGQPTKGNVYKGYNYRQFDGLFFYGQMMMEYYFKEKAARPEWPLVRTWKIGQPKTDSLFNEVSNPFDAKKQLYLDTTLKAILYAPSFEYCASLAEQGEEIINSLIATGLNVIVKPHPAFYRVVEKNDSYFYGVPHADEWRVRASIYAKTGKVVFPVGEQLDTKIALDAADVVVTDHSGIAFDAILLDKPVIYWDCPRFFSEYLPERFGVDGTVARDDICCNAGRSAGVIVNDTSGLLAALNCYLENPHLHAENRRQVREILLYNHGHATDVFVQTLMEITEKYND
jgi:hypothetical protein